MSPAVSLSFQNFGRPRFTRSPLHVDARVVDADGRLLATSPLADVDQPAQPFPRDVASHANEPGLPAGASVPRGPQLQDGVQPVSQDRVGDQVQDHQDPARPEPLPLGEI